MSLRDTYSRFCVPWCVWDHRKKCPDKKGICTSEEHRACEHHRKHGDMDGHTCLLNECALHYPISPSRINNKEAKK